MWTKRELAQEAFGELALAGFDFDITPEELQGAIRKMDTMLAVWEGKGIRIGYAFPATPSETDPDQESGIPDMAVEPVYMNLAVRLAAGYGKQVTPITRKSAREGYDTLLWRAAYPQQQQLPSTLPKGQGNKPWTIFTDPFFPGPVDDPLPVESGDLNIN